MSIEILLRGFFSFIISATFAYSIYDKQALEEAPGDDTDSRRRYVPYVPAFIYPLFLAVLFVLSTREYGMRSTVQHLLAMCFDVFLHTSLYYLLLLLAAPLLRKYISARVCAALWMLPNYLYFIHQGFMRLPRPLLVLRTSVNAIGLICLIWGIGFFAVMLWNLISHLFFRHRLLRNAQPVTDPDILELWQKEQWAAGFKKAPYRLVYSPAVKTPLSIGFFKRSIRVVLPLRSYSQEELALIFRHEIIHIGREDSTTKFFLVFCTAMCWFNPLMWIASRRSADDLELSCDETVLLSVDARTRHLYADLLLRTAGDNRGFTTCLSASARAMRYRLKNVMKPQRPFVGGIASGLIFFALIMSCGYIAAAYNEGTGQEYIFSGQEFDSYTIQNIHGDREEGLRYYDCLDETALNEYLGSLRLYEITGSYTFPDLDNEICVIYHGPEGAFGVTLRDDALKVTPLYGEKNETRNYYCSDEIDWGYLYSLTEPKN